MTIISRNIGTDLKEETDFWQLSDNQIRSKQDNAGLIIRPDDENELLEFLKDATVTYDSGNGTITFNDEFLILNTSGIGKRIFHPSDLTLPK